MLCILSNRLLEELLGAKVPRIYYNDFERKMTSTYGVVIDNWPLEKFAAPGDFNSQNDLMVLFNSWESGATRWRKLTNREALAREQESGSRVAEASEEAQEVLANIGKW